MSDARRALMVVHAHPDDESLGSGGTLQHYGRQGVRTVVVICTGGETGDPALAAAADARRLPGLRGLLRRPIH